MPSINAGTSCKNTSEKHSITTGFASLTVSSSLHFIQNDSASLVLNPGYNLEGFVLLAKEYKMEHRLQAIKEKMRKMLQKIMDEEVGRDLSTINAPGSSSPLRFDEEKMRFRPARRRALNQKSPHDRKSGLEEYCGGTIKELKDEKTIQYWRRLHQDHYTMRHLVHLARRVLSLPASSTNVERIFSQIGSVTGPYRGSLLPSTLIAQAGSKILMNQGFGKDI